MSQENKMPEQIAANLNTVEECERCIIATTRRAIEISAIRPSIRSREIELVEAELYEALEIRETTQRRPGTRFRPTIQKYGGIIRAVDRTVSKSRPNALGIFQKLAEFGLVDKTFEATIMRYPHLFSRQAQAKAKRNLGWVSRAPKLF